MHYIILGTAGHIDHGKSSLVKALTGIDSDRLKEEKERGITIDLGFAHLNYSDGLRVGIVDVPGHERLIKNMLAGAGGIDIVLMVIAADEGIMPQSKEHLAICDLLKAKKGLIAITKADIVEKDWLNLISEDIKNFVKGTFLEDSPLIPVSAKTGENIKLLKEKIRDVAQSIKPKPVRGLFRLPVDRVFTLKGFGTVVTGTAISGSISVDAPVEILSKGIKTKVRGLQSHGEAVKTAYAGQRVAVNLQGVSKEDIHRGDVLTMPEEIKLTSVLDAEIELLKDAETKLKNKNLVHFYTGTSELTGRIILYEKESLKPGDRAYCQIRLKSPVVAMSKDRYIIRRFSPLQTIGGGGIIDPLPRRRRRKDKIDDLKILKNGSLEEKLSAKIFQYGINGISLSELHGWINEEIPEIDNAVNQLIKKGEIIQTAERLLHKNAFKEFSQKISLVLSDFHKKNSLKPGFPKGELNTVFKGIEHGYFDELLKITKDIVVEREIVRLKSFNISLSDDKKAVKDKILKVIESHAFQPPLKEELTKTLSVSDKELGELLRIMAGEGSLVRINDSVYISAVSCNKMIESLKNFFKTKQEMTVAEFRDMLNTSRKYALPFLEYLDSNKITLRVGDIRKLFLKE
ncbi:MAG: selenocysteine-specific translation elongation factor [Nitrospirae bacterium]|nr:selenocysteine-specific translation elongation factor [Nitrospirota bacterium]